ncbi:hypothetical protein [Histophilus somni]|uniref:Uncharacterized protein n=1 Tax=Histophilus somni TaxID=731 RepID=A0AAX2S0S1_HISSO|nr:hypothetical protein [Histophilus somni]ACA32310.1 hypothetical protein HSM_0652 [Histophilus somni 2336]TDF40550.1 hypothetical protein E1290_05145 [Histophilus somni]TEW28970.1 hypothetical protein E2R48_07780 [Histophilus somni]TFF01095.1 hypothetical protein E3U35_07755 [Histophilus somni]THA21708.1 hypothetical protein E5361_04625 [Histophilus somni]
MLEKVAKYSRIFSGAVAITILLIAVPVFFIHEAVAIKLMASACNFFAIFVFFEVLNLKSWVQQNIATLIKSAEIASKAAYSLKQHKGLNLVVNGNTVTPDSSEREV